MVYFKFTAGFRVFQDIIMKHLFNHKSHQNESTGNHEYLQEI